MKTSRVSFEVDKGVVTGVAGAFEPPLPFLRGVERLASDLPIQQIGLLLLVAVGLDANVLVFLEKKKLFSSPLKYY